MVTSTYPFGELVMKAILFDPLITMGSMEKCVEENFFLKHHLKRRKTKNPQSSEWSSAVTSEQ